MSSLKPSIGRTLTFANGNAVTLKCCGTDSAGDYLILEHRIVASGAVNGPHSHPVLEETFEIVEGSMRFRVDGREIAAGPGERIVIRPNQMHQFWNTSEAGAVLRAVHEIRPPGYHWDMFALLHRLEAEGKLNAKGIPRNPLWLGMVWRTMDGYIAGPPRWMQRVALGGLARLADAVGYRM